MEKNQKVSVAVLLAYFFVNLKINYTWLIVTRIFFSDKSMKWFQYLQSTFYEWLSFKIHFFENLKRTIKRDRFSDNTF